MQYGLLCTGDDLSARLLDELISVLYIFTSERGVCPWLASGDVLTRENKKRERRPHEENPNKRETRDHQHNSTASKNKQQKRIQTQPSLQDTRQNHRLEEVRIKTGHNTNHTQAKEVTSVAINAKTVSKLD